VGALTLGPLVLSLDRAFAALGFAVLLLAAEAWARRGRRPEASAWAWRTAALTFVGARAGFVLSNLADYAAAPWTALAFWQGGFAPWWGVASGAAYALWAMRRDVTLRRTIPTVGVLALLAWWLPSAVLSPAPAASGVVIPAVVLADLGGGQVDLGAQGLPTVVNVWATWCPPCRRELPLFSAAARATPDVRVLLVNQREGADTVRGYLAAQGLSEAGVLLDRTGEVGARLNVAGLPTTFAFDAEGRLVDLHVGELSAARLRAMIAQLR